MGLDTGGTPRASGLKSALDTIVAPKEAFEQLRATPTWGWALLLAIVGYAVASYLMTPALLHATQSDWPRQIAANPQLAGLSPERQQKFLDINLGIVRFVWLAAPIVGLIAMLVQSLIMLVFKALGKGDAPFRALWAVAVNVAVPVLALNALITAVIVIVRGADSFNSPAEVQTAMPSLALLVPASAIKLHGFLAEFNPFTLWGCGLTIAAMTIVARVPRAWAWATGIAGLLIAGGLIAMAAR
jgi:hypothetical protein